MSNGLGVGLCGGVLVLMAACSHVHTEYLDDGSRAYVITCKGLMKTWESCLLKAGHICKSRGYDTVRKDEDDGMILIACKSPS